MSRIAIDDSRDILLVVDMQNDFCPEGALGVPGGDEVLPVANRLMERFAHVALTQDWHPAGHGSFASAHEGYAPFDSFEMPYGPQTLWPDHCVQGTRGAAFHDALDTTRAELVIRKGYDAAIDSYSAFYENDRRTPTGLTGYLRTRGFSRVVLVGLATDFCVAFSALDAVRHGFQTHVRLDACRGINLNGSMETMLNRMLDAGVTLA